MIKVPCCFAQPSALENPGVDSAVTMVSIINHFRDPPKRAGNPPSIVLHHGDWSVETSNDPGEYKFHMNHIKRIRVSDLRELDGSRSVVWFRRQWLREEEPGHDVPTGRFRDLAGERCEVWTLRTQPDQKSAAVTCLTQDGIELAQGWGSGGKEYWHQEAIQVERRPVMPAEVEPSEEALRLTVSARAAAMLSDRSGGHATSATPNVEVVLSETTARRPDADRWIGFVGEISRVQRRYGDWLSKQSAYAGGARKRTLENRSLGLSLSIDHAADGSLSWFLATKTTPGSDAIPRRDRALVQHGSMTTRYGDCDWWVYPMPKFFEPRPSECRAPDDMLLAMEEGTKKLEATSMRRGALSLSDILIQASDFDAEAWQLSLSERPAVLPATP